MKDESSEAGITVYLDELSPEAQEMVRMESKRTGESMEEVANRLLLEAGRRRFPGLTSS